MVSTFTASLVREKLDITADPPDGRAPLVVRSNRLSMALQDADKKTPAERIAIRGQNMHVTLRLAARAAYNFFRNGNFTGRDIVYDWQDQWDNLLSSYERGYNRHLWGAAYIDGRPVFKTGEVPEALDMIEAHAMSEPEHYEASFAFAENALAKSGQNAQIHQEANIAGVFANMDGAIRCGIIHRAQGKAMTFNMVVSGGIDENRIPDAFFAAACFLEALNLKFICDTLKHKERQGEAASSSPDGRRLKSAQSRMGELNKEIHAFENKYTVRYRPERPALFESV